MHLLTHETMHMTGLTSEAETECLATQRDADMARALGASPADAHSLATAYWIGVYQHMPETYRSADCQGPASP